MNPLQLAQVISDREQQKEKIQDMSTLPNTNAKNLDKIQTGLQNKKHYSEQDVSVQDQNQKDMEQDIDRQETSNLSNWHSSRSLPHFQLTKIMDSESSWNGLFRIEDKRGKPLPKALDQSFTDVGQAVRAIQTYLKTQKEIKNHE